MRVVSSTHQGIEIRPVDDVLHSIYRRQVGRHHGELVRFHAYGEEAEEHRDDERHERVEVALDAAARFAALMARGTGR